jgi:hypothetical protein
MKKTLIAVCLIGLSYALHAETIRYSFSGNLTMLRDDGNDLPASIDINDTFVANFDYDLDKVNDRGFRLEPDLGSDGFLFTLEIDSAQWAWSSAYMHGFGDNGVLSVGSGDWGVNAQSNGLENPGFTSYLGNAFSQFFISDSVVYESGTPNESNLSFLSNIGDPGHSFFTIASTGPVGHEWQIILHVTTGSVSTIPESSTYALLLAGVAFGFAFARRRSRK